MQQIWVIDATNKSSNELLLNIKWNNKERNIMRLNEDMDLPLKRTFITKINNCVIKAFLSAYSS